MFDVCLYALSNQVDMSTQMNKENSYRFSPSNDNTVVLFAEGGHKCGRHFVAFSRNKKKNEEKRRKKKKYKERKTIKK